MDVVEQVDAEAEALAHRGQQRGHVAQVLLGRPHRLLQLAGGRGLVRARIRHGAVDALQAGHARLHAHRAVAALEQALDRGQRVVDRLPARVRVGEHAVARAAAEQLVERHPRRLGLDVPQRGVDRGDRRHRDRPAAPVGALVEQLPGVLDARRVAAGQQRADVLAQVRRDRQLAAVERRVAEAGQPVAGRQLERDEVAPRAADDDLGGRDRAHVAASCTHTCSGSKRGAIVRPSPAITQR